VIGPTDADLKIVEFMNYGCDKCRNIHPNTMEAIQKDGKVRLIIRPVVEQGDWSEMLVQYVYAAGEQGKFLEMHEGIIENWPIDDELFLIKYAENLDLDLDQLSRDVQSDEIKELVKINQDIFIRWQLNTVPTFFVGKAAVFRPRVESITTEEWLEKFKKARAGS
jgi:protein-disulfide isomerase